MIFFYLDFLFIKIYLFSFSLGKVNVYKNCDAFERHYMSTLTAQIFDTFVVFSLVTMSIKNVQHVYTVKIVNNVNPIK